MDKIAFSFHSRTTNFQPKYDKEAGILSISDPGSNDWPFGIDIDGLIIIDLNDEMILSNIDIILPRRLWKVDEDLKKPVGIRSGNIKISSESISHKSFHIPKKVLSNRAKQLVYVRIGDIEEETQWFELSEKFLIEVKDCYILGFFVVL